MKWFTHTEFWITFLFVFTWTFETQGMARWSDWTVWSKCTVTCNGGVSHRSKECIDETGDLVFGCPDTTYHEERGCGKRPCPAGQKTQTGMNLAPAHQPRQPGPNRPKSSSQPAARQPSRSQSSQNRNSIIGDWSEWSECSCRTREKHRTRECFAEDKHQCSRMTITYEGVPCDPDVDCRAFEEEQQQREEQQQMMVAYRQQAQQEMAMEAFGPWTEWSTCSCTKRTKYHVRECVALDRRRCSGSSYESVACQPTGCTVSSPFSPWGPWSTCSCTSREQVRTRQCTPLGGPCAEPTSEQRSCEPTGCNVATVSSSRPNSGNNNGEDRKNKGGTGSVTAPSFTSWSMWSPCQCSTKQKTRKRICNSRTIANCPNRQKSQIETMPCSPRNCKVSIVSPSGNQLDQSRQPASAQFSAWGTWSQCSCETREMTRQRTCSSKAVNACPAGGTQTQEKACTPIGCQNRGTAGGNHMNQQQRPLEIPGSGSNQFVREILEIPIERHGAPASSDASAILNVWQWSLVTATMLISCGL